MQESEIVILEKIKMKNPVCVVGLPGIGNIGRIAIGYLTSQLKAKKFAELYSPFFFPFVMIHNSEVHMLRNEFYHYKNKGKDFIFVIGDSQSFDPKGHYEVAGKILGLSHRLGCKKIITIGGFGTGKVVEKPKVYGVVTERSDVAEYKKLGINFDIEGKIGTIIGASGLLVGLGKKIGMKGLVLLGETSGFPIITDPNSAEAVLVVLQKVLGLKVDLKKLDERVKAMHEFISKLEDIQRQTMEQMQKPKKNEELKYIG